MVGGGYKGVNPMVTGPMGRRGGAAATASTSASAQGDLDRRFVRLAVRAAASGALADATGGAQRDAGGQTALAAADLERFLEALPNTAWADIVRSAEAIGVGALLSHSLQRSAPSPARADLVDLARRTRLRGDRLLAERRAAGFALSWAGVAHLWLKGAWLAEIHYPEPAARPMADLDLLVRQGDLEAASDALGTLGYRPAGRTWKHTIFRLPGNSSIVDARGEHPDNPRPVEVHTRLVAAVRGIGLEMPHPLGMGNRSTVTRSPGAGAGDGAGGGVVAADVARAAQLVAHASTDAVELSCRPIAFIDLALAMADQPWATWSALLDTFGSHRGARCAWPALSIAARELPGSVPPAVLARLAPLVRPSLRAWAARQDIWSVSRAARGSEARTGARVLRIWPIDAGERLRMMRFMLWPARWHLADRDPELAASSRWPRMYFDHIAYLLGQVARLSGRR